MPITICNVLWELPLKNQKYVSISCEKYQKDTNIKPSVPEILAIT